MLKFDLKPQKIFSKYLYASDNI